MESLMPEVWQVNAGSLFAKTIEEGQTVKKLYHFMKVLSRYH